MTPSSADSELAKKAFKLNLKSTSVEDSSKFVPKQLSKDSDIRSPLSPNSGKQPKGFPLENKVTRSLKVSLGLFLIDSLIGHFCPQCEVAGRHVPQSRINHR